MMERRVWHCQNIYEIRLDFFKKEGFKGVLLDLDNTLDNPFTKRASKRAKEKLEELKGSGLFVAIVSNNTKSRISKYLGNLEIDGFLPNSNKPSPDKILDFLRKNQLDPKEVVLIGDQVFTDGGAAKNCDLNFILTERLSKLELPWTYFNRLRESFVRKKWLAEGRFGDKI